MFINLFSPEEKAYARGQKRKLLIIWFLLLAVTLAIVLTLSVTSLYLVNVYRNRDHTIWMGVLAAAAAIIFCCFSLFFFSIKFRLTSKYVRMLRDMERGLKDEVEAKFMGYDETISMKDGCYFYSMVLEARPLKREDITERKVLIEHTKAKPEIIEGTRILVKSHANIMIGYEILPEKSQEEKNL